MPKFKVYVSKYVQEIAVIEIEASDSGMAAQLASAASDEADWQDGNDSKFFNVDRVEDA